MDTRGEAAFVRRTARRGTAWHRAVVAVAVALAAVAALAAAATAQAATLEWVQYLHGPLGDSSEEAVVTDAAGNAYVAGFSNLGRGGIDGVVSEVTAAGAHVWDVAWDGAAGGDDLLAAAVLDRARRTLYVAGVSERASGHYQLVTMAFSTGGVRRWVRTSAAPTGQEFPWVEDLGLDARGNVYVAVTAITTGGGEPTKGYVLKYTRTGTLKWRRSWAPTGRGFCLNGMAVAAGGQVAFTGADYEDSDYRDVRTAVLSTDGRVSWTARWAGADGSRDICYGIAFGPGRSVYVGGATVSPATGEDALLLKYSRSGRLAWDAMRDGGASQSDKMREVAVDAAGNVYAGGWGCREGTSRYGMWTLSYSTTGAFRWEQWSAAPVDFRGGSVNSLVLSSDRLYVAGGVESATDGQWAAQVAEYPLDGGKVGWMISYGGGTLDPWGQTWSNGLALGLTGQVYVVGLAYRPPGLPAPARPIY